MRFIIVLAKYQLMYYYHSDQKSIDVTDDGFFFKKSNNNNKRTENKIVFGKHNEKKLFLNNYFCRKVMM
jgi:hypothetical protein